MREEVSSASGRSSFFPSQCGHVVSSSSKLTGVILSALSLEAAAPAARVPEAAAAAGLTNGPPAPGQAGWLGRCGQAASHQVFAGDPKGRSPADEAAQRAAASAASHCDSADPPPDQNCTHILILLSQYTCLRLLIFHFRLT